MSEKPRTFIIGGSLVGSLENKRKAIKYKRIEILNEIVKVTSLPIVVINMIIDNLFKLCSSCGADNFIFGMDFRDSFAFRDNEVNPYCISCDVCKEMCKNCMYSSHMDACGSCYEYSCLKKMKRCPGNGCRKRICCGDYCERCVARIQESLL